MSRTRGKPLPTLAAKLALTGLDRSAGALIGVSGGKDSVALLHLLAASGFERLIVCHLDHGMRPESEEEAQFVAGLARQLGYHFESERQDVRSIAGKRRLSLETAGRFARHDFFGRVALARGITRLFLAHHADDQVETFLLHLFRGAGGPGLRGMQERCKLQLGQAQLEVVRPMLNIWRREIDEWVTTGTVEYREDASNALPDHTRNRVRHDLIPRLSDIFGREAGGPVLRAAGILAEEDAVLCSVTQAAEATIIDHTTSESLRVAELRGQPIAIQRRLVFRWLVERGIEGIEFADVEAVRGLALGVNPAKVNLPKGRFARRREGRIFLQ